MRTVYPPVVVETTDASIVTTFFTLHMCFQIVVLFIHFLPNPAIDTSTIDR